MNTKGIKRTRIAILDDHAVARYGWAKCLEEELDMLVVGVYAFSRELIDALHGSAAGIDVLVTDYSLGPQEIDGINLIRFIRARYPAIRIVVASSSYNKATVALAVHAGVHGFVGKDEELSELVRAVRIVATGRMRIAESMAADIGAGKIALRREASTTQARDTPGDVANFSPREREVLRCCLDGMSIKDIAGKFARSYKTISAQKQSAYHKLGIGSDLELVRIRPQLERLWGGI